jgi:outer membrane protein insertion porin family
MRWTSGAVSPPGEGRTVLMITVEERPLLGRVRVEGPKAIAGRTVEDMVDMLIGRPVDPADVARGVSRIDSLYESKGYYLARMRGRLDAPTDNGRLDITFRVDEGRRLAISGVRIEGNTEVSDKEIVGAMKVKPEGFLWFRKGEFDEDKYATDLGEHIPDLFASRGYVDFQLDRDTLIVDRSAARR